MIERACHYGCYVYRRVVAMLIDAGRQLNDKRVERLWRRKGLEVPMKQPMRSRLWLNDGSCIRLRPQHVDHVWSYDFVHHRRVGRECLTIRVKIRLNSTDVIDTWTDLFIIRDVPSYIRTDNEPEFIAEAVRQWIKAVGAETANIEPGQFGRTVIAKASTFPRTSS